MRDYLDQLTLSAETVSHRIHFLQARADTHFGAARESADRRHHDERLGAMATCLTQMACLGLLKGNEDVATWLQEASNWYIGTDLCYGLFIGTVPGPKQPNVVECTHQFVGRLQEQIPHRDSLEGEPLALPEWFSPNQQLYFYLTQARKSRWDVPTSLTQWTRHNLALHANTPHGPHGVPIQVYLDLADALSEFQKRVNTRNTGINAIRPLQRLALAYHHSVEAARHNPYLWNNLWSPVEYLDIELVTLAALTAEAAGGVDILNDCMRPLPTIAKIPIEIAKSIFITHRTPEGGAKRDIPISDEQEDHKDDRADENGIMGMA
jgi:hypothetical protein